MKTRVFYAQSDFNSVVTWCEARGQQPPSLTDLPTLGFVAFDELTGAKLAACWLCRTDSSFSIMEWATTNPDMPSNIRDMALDLLQKEVEKCSEGLGYSMVVAITKIGVIAGRLERTGYVRAPEETVCLYKKHANI